MTGETTIGDPRPKPLRSLEDDLATDGLVVDFLAGVWAGAGVVVGDMGRLRFLDRLAGCFAGRSDAGGMSLATLVSISIASESESRFECCQRRDAFERLEGRGDNKFGYLLDPRIVRVQRSGIG